MWLEEDFDAVASEHFHSNSKVVAQTDSSLKRAVSAKKPNLQQVASKAAFENQAPHPGESSTRVGTKLSKYGAKRSSGGRRREVHVGSSGRASGGGKKGFAGGRGGGFAEGRRPKGFPAAPTGGTKGKSAIGGGGAIRPMGANFPRG